MGEVTSDATPAHQHRSLFELLRDHPSGWLLLAQLAAIVVLPFAEELEQGRIYVTSVSLVILTLAVWTVRGTPALTWISATLALPALLLEVWSAADPGNVTVFVAAHSLLAVFYLYTGYGLIAYVFGDHDVTVDELFAVAAAFTVFAWAFAYAFLVVQALVPGSFTSADGVGEQSFLELLYLSVANFTSVGLSDVLPVASHARSVVMLEHIGGVFYVAMVISRLIALTARHR